MSDFHPNAAEVLHTVLSVGRERVAAHGMDLPEPVVDGGGPSSTFTAAVFAGELLGLPSWGGHVAVRIPDAIHDLGRPGLPGHHLGVFRQVFFSLPQRLLGGRDPEALTRSVMDAINQSLLGAAEPLLFRAYQWNANSTRMTGEAKEVNLASGVARGMEIAQLNRIEQVGGVRLPEACYLIVIGVDRLAYYLSLRDRFRDSAVMGAAADFYRMAPDLALALQRLHHKILFADRIRPGSRGRLDGDLTRLEQELAGGRPVTEETLQRFREVNIILETLFMTRHISGGLRQGCIGRIGDVAKRLARAILAHPEEGRALATAARAGTYVDAAERTERLLLSSVEDADGHIETAGPGMTPDVALPDRVERWHAAYVAENIDRDLLGGLSERDRTALADWIAANGDAIDTAAQNTDSELPVGFAAVRVSDERPVLVLDLAMTPAELRTRLEAMAFVGVDGRGRRERQERLFALLEEAGAPVPPAVGRVLPYLGIENAFRSTRVFDRPVDVLVEAWLERHLPELLDVHGALDGDTPPVERPLQYCWAALRIELIARYLLLRTAAGKPLWQDPYGARHLLNRQLLPLWRESPPPQSLRQQLIDGAVQGIEVPAAAVHTVREYLAGKLLALR